MIAPHLGGREGFIKKLAPPRSAPVTDPPPQKPNDRHVVLSNFFLRCHDHENVADCPLIHSSKTFSEGSYDRELRLLANCRIITVVSRRRNIPTTSDRGTPMARFPETMSPLARAASPVMSIQQMTAGWSGVENVVAERACHGEVTGSGGQPVRAFISLAPYLSVTDWRARHSNDEVPDATPYGLHKMERYGVVPEFAEHAFSRLTTLLGKAARRSSGGLNVVEALSESWRQQRKSCDLFLCYDEWNGIPMTLFPSSTLPPVVMKIDFLAERARTPHRLRTAASIAIPRAAAVFAHTHTMAGVLNSDWGVPSERLTVIPFGIDTDFYQLQPPPDVPGVVVSAGEDVLRDHALLIKAVSQVKERNENVWLELATGMKADVPPDLGRVHKQRLYGKMRELYRRSSIVAVAVHPTSSRSSGSTVVLEGMASGRPVVATANPALAEFVDDGVTGILVPPGDADAMANAIAGLLADPDRAAEMGRAAAEEVRKKFTTDTMAKGLADLALSL